jgi:hypothetical protein
MGKKIKSSVFTLFETTGNNNNNNNNNVEYS